MEYRSATNPFRVVLYPSEIGNILSQNRFCSRTETLKRVWYRMKGNLVPEPFRPSPDYVQLIGNTKKGAQIRRKKYTLEHFDEFESIVADLKRSLEADGHREMVDAAPRFLRCEMGRNSEVLAIDIAEQHPAIGRCKSMQQSYCKRVWSSGDGAIEILVSGRIDCYDQMGRVVEIKTRVARRPCVEPHETTQLQMYLFLTDAHSGYVVELHDKDQLTIGQLFTFDEKWWNEEVIPALTSFVDDLITSMKASTLVILDDITIVGEGEEE